MNTLLLLVMGWCLLSVATALGLGPLMRKAAVLAEARDVPRGVPAERTAA